MKKVDEFINKAKNDYGYNNRQIYNYVVIQSELYGLDRKKVEKYLNKKLKENGV